MVWYTDAMLDEMTFRRHAEAALGALKKALLQTEGQAEFEVEEQGGALNILFEDPPARFVLAPNGPVRQIWISALYTSFKLDWDDALGDFIYHKTGEKLRPLVARLINEQLGGGDVVLP